MTEAPVPVQGEQATSESGTTPETPEGYVPQKDVSKIAANEKREGKKSAQTEILEKAQQYGVESLDDVFSVLEAHHLTQAEMETEADRESKRAEKAEAAAQAANERYTTTLREFALRDALRDADINPERLRGAMRLADLSALEVDKEGNISGLEDVVGAVQKEAPEFFGEPPRPRVSAPQTSGTDVEQASGANDDPKARMGRSLFSWLTDPISEDEKSQNQQGTWP